MKCPVCCARCDEVHELHESHFYTKWCDCLRDEACNHGLCSECFEEIVDGIKPGPERTVALRKLLEAKDAAVRARLSPGG